jgi:hypothetical protein
MNLTAINERTLRLTYDYEFCEGEAWTRDPDVPMDMAVHFFRLLDPRVKQITLHYPDKTNRLIWREGENWHSNRKDTDWA